MIRYLYPFVAALAAVAVVGCSPTVDQRGFVAPQEGRERLLPGAHTRDDVLAVLGSPSTVAAFDPNTWFYVGATTARTAFLDPGLLERRILVVGFDDTGTLERLEEIDPARAQAVTLVGRETPTAGRSLSFLEQIVGNIGRFNAPDGAP